MDCPTIPPYYQQSSVHLPIDPIIPQETEDKLALCATLFTQVYCTEEDDATLAAILRSLPELHIAFAETTYRGQSTHLSPAYLALDTSDLNKFIFCLAGALNKNTALEFCQFDHPFIRLIHFLGRLNMQLTEWSNFRMTFTAPQTENQLLQSVTLLIKTEHMQCVAHCYTFACQTSTLTKLSLSGCKVCSSDVTNIKAIFNANPHLEEVTLNYACEHEEILPLIVDFLNTQKLKKLEITGVPHPCIDVVEEQPTELRNTAMNDLMLAIAKSDSLINVGIQSSLISRWSKGMGIFSFFDALKNNTRLKNMSLTQQGGQHNPQDNLSLWIDKLRTENHTIDTFNITNIFFPQ